MKIRCFLSCLLLILSACQSPKWSIVVPESLVGNSDMYALEKPAWRVSDSVFDQALGDYKIANTDVSWTTKETKVVSVERESNLFGYLFLGTDYAFTRENLEINEETRFSFSLSQTGEPVNTANCNIYTLSSDEKLITQKEILSYSQSTLKGKPRRAFLSCNIKTKNKTWQLVLNAERFKNLKVELKTGDELITGRAISDARDENTSRNLSPTLLPPWLASNTGLSLIRRQNLLSAIQMVGDPKIWLTKDINSADKQVLLSANYAILMFDWLADWR